MGNGSQDLPLCSRLLGPDEIVHYLRLASMRARLADFAAGALPPDTSPLDREELEELRDEASRHRDFRWSVLPGDKVWLTADPPRHPEAEHGVPHLVIVRGGTVVFRYRLGNWTGPGLESPILAPTMRLTRDEVVTIASDWVRAHYPIVPAVADVREFSDRTLDQLEQRAGATISQEKRRQISNEWCVSFACSWETDEAGMPMSLLVLVDDTTGQAELAPDG
jgi:hypothetical protein